MSTAAAAICHRVQAEPPGYRRRRPETTVLYQVVARELQTFLARTEQRDGPGLPAFVRRELAALLDCGILARGFARVRCKGCGDDLLVAFSPPVATG